MSIKISMNLFPVAASPASPSADAPVTCMVGAAPLEPAAFKTELCCLA